MVTYNEAKNRVQRNDESTDKNISFLEKKAWGYFLKFAKLTKTHRKVDPALIPHSCSNQFQKKQPKLILNCTSTFLERPKEIYFLILNKVSIYLDFLCF